ncbi:MAG: hypothetical protein LBG79_09050 [Spirochaetaceae bacterium]|jgi:hypothetical protein|nr:hypothetical protein [Spirochaetaceae bacterium]GMO29417.1 MAG: hypothetical protein Pg6A_17550 [Termitinemataceae bacterium]
MNTTHSTFEPIAAAVSEYAVLGGTQSGGSTGLSAVLLNRGSRYPRRQVFNALMRSGFDSIISVETGEEHYEIESLAASFPCAKFVLIKGQPSLGEQINIAAEELRSPLFFVLWNDLRILYGLSAGKIAERLVLPVNEVALDKRGNWFRRICTVPVFQNARFEQLPTLVVPLNNKNRFEITLYAAVKESAPSFFPFQGVGVYDRERFLTLGGFDTEIKNEYWQLADFGIRSWLRGEEIRYTNHIHLRYGAEFFYGKPIQDSGYWRFFVKNLLPVVKPSGDTLFKAYLPLKKLPALIFKSNEAPAKSAHRFFSTREWLKTNGSRWICSVSTLLNNWKEI